MGIEITDYVPPVKPRKESPYDPVIADLAQYDDGTKAATLTESTENFSKELRKFREAARHAGFRTRERSRTEDAKAQTVSVSLTIHKRKEKAEAAEVSTDNADEGESED